VVDGATESKPCSGKGIDHYLSLEDLTEEFGENGWKKLPDAISRCYKFIPALPRT